MPRPTLMRVLLPLLALSLVACGGAGDEGADAAGAGSDASPARSLELTEADLDLYERGLRSEIELVRAAQERSRTATTPQERGDAMQAQWKERTIPEAARTLGVDPARYQQVREAVHQVLETLDFQGKIEGPMQLDTTRASPEMRARLARDPIADLPPAAAAALRARLDRLAPIFAEYVTLTAVAG